ncbi:MAG: hypothetical protein AB1Z98_24950 [Nannocystaceae bacterium]
MRSQDIEIPEPCHADWASMRPEDRGRYCFECKTKVHDLSAMTKAEAQRFLERTAHEEVCVSYEHAADGSLVFRAPPPPPAPVVPISRLRRPRTMAAAVVGAGMAAALAACAPHGEGPKVREVDEISFEGPTTVIPHGQAAQGTPARPPVEAVVTEPEGTDADEPCQTLEPEPPEVADERRPVKGKRVPVTRTAGRPVQRTAGAKRAR